MLSAFLQLSTALQCFVVIAPYVGFQVYGFLRYCPNQSGIRRSWCDDVVPHLYGFVQKEYWCLLQISKFSSLIVQEILIDRTLMIVFTIEKEQ